MGCKSLFSTGFLNRERFRNRCTGICLKAETDAQLNRGIDGAEKFYITGLPLVVEVDHQVSVATLYP